jgi:hypothetical protein
VPAGCASTTRWATSPTPMGTAAPLAHRVGGDGAGAVVVVGRVVVVVGRVVVVVGRVVVVVGRVVVDRRVVGVDVVAEPDRTLPPQSDEHAASPSRADRATPTRVERANVVVSLDMVRFLPIDLDPFPSGTAPQRHNPQRVVRLVVCPPAQLSTTLYGMGWREALKATRGLPTRRVQCGNSISGRDRRA